MEILQLQTSRIKKRQQDLEMINFEISWVISISTILLGKFWKIWLWKILQNF